MLLKYFCAKLGPSVSKEGFNDHERGVATHWKKTSPHEHDGHCNLSLELCYFPLQVFVTLSFYVRLPLGTPACPGACRCGVQNWLDSLISAASAEYLATCKLEDCIQASLVCFTLKHNPFKIEITKDRLAVGTSRQLTLDKAQHIFYRKEGN